MRSSTAEQTLSGTVLVTGATSRTGSRVAAHLRRRGATVRMLLYGPGPAPHGERFARADPASRADCERALHGVDSIVHIGCPFEGMDGWQAEAYNFEATTNLAAAAIAVGATRFILVSSYVVYPRGLGRPSREGDPAQVRGDAPMTGAKAGAEQALRQVSPAGGLGTRILRPGFTYGDGDPHLYELLVWRAGSSGEKLVHLAHHADVAQVVELSLYGEPLVGDVVNVADARPVQLATIRNTLPRREGTRMPRVAPLGDQPWSELVDDGDAHEGLLDTTRCRELSGFSYLVPTLGSAARMGRL